MKKMKKTYKGMTLIEMIITIAILAMLCVILAMVGSNIDATTRATNNLKDKVVKESPYAANQVVTFVNQDGDNVYFASQTATVVVRVPGKYSFNNKEYPDPQVNLDATRYDTEQIVLEGRSDKEKKVIQEGPNSGLNLKFIELHVTTAATTTTTTAPTTTSTTK